jgi:hypothetical protein
MIELGTIPDFEDANNIRHGAWLVRQKGKQEVSK